MRRRVRTTLSVFALVLAAPAVAGAAAPQAEPGWTQRALGIQYEVASDVGWANMPWVGTHNSYNSTAQTGVALSSNDANQRITNVAQLEAGIRSLELDVHRFPDVSGGPLRVCHARGADQGHFGCTLEKELGPTLEEIVAWLDRPENEDEVLLLYLEDHMGDAAGYNAAAAVVESELGDRLYEPQDEGCTEVPATLTRDDVRAAGAQVLIVSDCGPSAATGWHGVAHNWDSHVESRPVGYEDFPTCGPDYEIAEYESLFVRYYEDRTALTNSVGPPTGVATPDDGIDAGTAAAMARCGVDLIGLDLLRGPQDRRLEGLVWSWQVNRPRPARKGERNCAVQRRNVEVAPEFGFAGESGTGAGDDPPTRAAWFDQVCARLHAAACRDAEGAWTILPERSRQSAAKRACEAEGLVLGTPRTGYESQQLDTALAAADERQAWLGIRRKGAAWRPQDPPLAP
jgi:hypothetical protein